MKEFYDEAIEQLSEERDRIDEFEDLYGLNEDQQKLVRCIQGDKLDKINGKMIRGIKSEAEKPAKPAVLEGNRIVAEKVVQKFKSVWFAQLASFKQTAREFYEKEKFALYEGYSLDTIIVEDPKPIYDFFDGKHLSFALVYRASAHAFSAAKFHTLCDGMESTLTLLQTEYGKVIGGYTPLAWGSSDSDKYVVDEKEESFIFSYTLNEKYPLTQKSHTICHNSGWGPSFGRAHDIAICNEANTRQSSYFDFPTSYNNGRYERDQTSIKAFGGSSEGHKARVLEW